MEACIVYVCDACCAADDGELRGSDPKKRGPTGQLRGHGDGIRGERADSHGAIHADCNAVRITGCAIPCSPAIAATNDDSLPAPRVPWRGVQVLIQE